MPVIVCRTIFTRVIDIDIDHMLGKISHERKPTWITAAGVLDNSPINGIILVVIVRDERGIALVPNRFVIGIEIPKMPPAVLIDNFTPIKKGVVPLNGRIDQSLIVSMLIGATRGKVADGLRVGIPFWRGPGLQSAVPPAHVGHGLVLPIKLQPDSMRLLLATLEFIDITDTAAGISEY